MNIKEQTLNVEQVRELQELGFDVEKYSSLKSNGKQIITKDDFYIGGAPLFSTMTIGDIIEVLPENIDNNFFLMFEKDYVAYNNRYLVLMSKEEKNLITALFETLKWCIKQKHIAINRKEEKPKLTCYLGNDMAR